MIFKALKYIEKMKANYQVLLFEETDKEIITYMRILYKIFG